MVPKADFRLMEYSESDSEYVLTIHKSYTHSPTVIINNLCKKKVNIGKMVNKKQVLIALGLIVIGIATIAWAQAVIGVITLTPASYDPTVSVTTPTFQITADSQGTAPDNGTVTVSNVHFNYTSIKVSLVDLGGLYRSMKSLTVTFINATGNVQYAELTLSQPVAEFLYNSTTTSKTGSITINYVVSWIAEATVASPIRFAITGEVVGTFDYKTS